MLRLILMRHSTAEPMGSGGDHARRLSQSGQHDAEKAGRALFGLIRPDAVLLSDSTRTSGTVERVALAFPALLPRQATRKLYEATADDILREIRATPDPIRTLLVVGHNPGIGDLARALAGAAAGHDDARRAALATRFPTSGFVVLALAEDTWRDVGGSGRLEALSLTPGEIAT